MTSRPASRPPAPRTLSHNTALIDPPDRGNPPGATPTGPRPTAPTAGAWATGPDGASVEAMLETGESYGFTAVASVRAVEETLERTLGGAFSPAAAFGSEFAFSVEGSSRLTAQHHRQ